jgi:hypothetical protein
MEFDQIRFGTPLVVSICACSDWSVSSLLVDVVVFSRLLAMHHVIGEEELTRDLVV